MFARIESVIRRVHRRASRSEWAIRHMGLPAAQGGAELPGLLMIQIDGLSNSQLTRALARGRMPFLQRLLKRNGYERHIFYPGLPSTTPAVQAELFYGVRTAVPAFSFLERKPYRVLKMSSPAEAKAVEARCAAGAGEGLLKGGSSWSNIYTGGAGQGESHFCIASNGFGDMWRTGKLRNIFVFILMQFPAALRIAGLLVLECVVGFWNAFRGIWRGENPLLELFMVLSRVFVGIGLRELVTIGGKVDVTRGLPIVHINFVGYDEHAHRRGPGSRFAHWSLSGIDRAIKNLWREAHRSQRRDYSVWIYSDHGQEHTRSFALEFPGAIEGVVRDFLGRAPVGAPVLTNRRPRPQGPRTTKLRMKSETGATVIEGEAPPFTFVAMGPVGHLYFAAALTGEQRRALAVRLVSEGRVPGVLWRDDAGAVRWLHGKGETRVPDEVPALLPHLEPMRLEIARDLAALCESPRSGDLVLVGWSPGGGPWSFAPEHGAHAGFGPEETAGFALLPAGTHLPPGAEHFIRPDGLRLAALELLGRQPPRMRTRTKGERHLRVMTYNTHGCGGMDGRVSPRRIARVIAAQRADIIALQELDLGRRRSRAEDQAAMIAQELGLHFVFCPAITRGEEHYGHALLSHWPIEVVKRARLPADSRSWWQEPRVALWVRVRTGTAIVNVITTHLGLGWNERRLQMRALLGDEWLGAVPDGELAILCGDFNLPPGSAPYKLAAARLRDVQGRRKTLRTFSSTRPMIRIDHIFTSSQFESKGVFVPRGDLTRVASDHLPLVADLLMPAAVAAPTTADVGAERRMSSAAAAR